MKLGKLINQTITLVECENGVEVNGTRTEGELYADGWKKACLTPKENPTDTERWEEYPTCLVQTWIAEQQEEPMEE